jgi:hypothetical protein
MLPELLSLALQSPQPVMLDAAEYLLAEGAPLPLLGFSITAGLGF